MIYPLFNYTCIIAKMAIFGQPAKKNPATPGFWHTTERGIEVGIKYLMQEHDSLRPRVFSKVFRVHTL